MSIYIHTKGRQEGPFSIEVINKRISQGTLAASSAVAWKEGMEDWVPLTDLPGISSSPRVPPPVPPGFFIPDPKQERLPRIESETRQVFGPRFDIEPAFDVARRAGFIFPLLFLLVLLAVCGAGSFVTGDSKVIYRGGILAFPFVYSVGVLVSFPSLLKNVPRACPAAKPLLFTFLATCMFAIIQVFVFGKLIAVLEPSKGTVPFALYYGVILSILFFGRVFMLSLREKSLNPNAEWNYGLSIKRHEILPVVIRLTIYGVIIGVCAFAFFAWIGKYSETGFQF